MELRIGLAFKATLIICISSIQSHGQVDSMNIRFNNPEILSKLEIVPAYGYIHDQNFFSTDITARPNKLYLLKASGTITPSSRKIVFPVDYNANDTKYSIYLQTSVRIEVFSRKRESNKFIEVFPTISFSNFKLNQLQLISPMKKRSMSFGGGIDFNNFEQRNVSVKEGIGSFYAGYKYTLCATAGLTYNSIFHVHAVAYSADCNLHISSTRYRHFSFSCDALFVAFRQDYFYYSPIANSIGIETSEDESPEGTFEMGRFGFKSRMEWRSAFPLMKNLLWSIGGEVIVHPGINRYTFPVAQAFIGLGIRSRRYL